MVNLFNSVRAGPVFMHFRQDSDIFCHQPEVACDVISVTAVRYVAVDVRLQFGRSRSNRS